MSSPPPTSRAATFGQLCVIAREQIQAEPSIDDFEWKHRIKDRLIELRFEIPAHSDGMARAMSAVERALAKCWGPRPSSLPPPRPPPRTNPSAPPPTPQEATAALARVSASCKPPSPISASSSGMTALAQIAAGTSDSRPPVAKQTDAQIAAWRASQPRRRWRATAKGWAQAAEE